MILTKEFRFEASHQLYNHPGKCARLHGHSWVLKVAVKGDIDPITGMVMDYGDIKTVVQPLIDRLDHHHLGNGHLPVGDIHIPATVEGFNVDLPTSENILIWIADQVGYNLPWYYMCLQETCTCEATLYYEEWHTRRYLRHPSYLQPKTKSKLEITDDDIPF